MLQVVGIAMFMAAGIGMGVIRAGELYARPRQIRAVIRALSALEAQIVYARTPLAEGFRRCIAGCSEDTVKRLFLLLADRLSADRRCDAAEACEAVRTQMSKCLSAGGAEWNVLLFLCDNLGRTDCREAEKQIRLALEQLKLIEQNADREAKEKGKAVIYLSVCGALMAVVICI